MPHEQLESGRRPDQRTGTARAIMIAAAALLCAACGSPMNPTVDADYAATSTMTATANTVGYQLQVTVTVTNHGSAAIHYEGNSCGAVDYELYAAGSPTNGTPLWRSPYAVCMLVSIPKVLAPGDSVTMGASYPTGNVDIDEPPPPAGTYMVRARVRFAGTIRHIDAGTITIGT